MMASSSVESDQSRRAHEPDQNSSSGTRQIPEQDQNNSSGPKQGPEQDHNSSPGANPPPEAASRSLEGQYSQQSSPPTMAGLYPHQPPHHYHQPHHPHAMGYPPIMGYPPGNPPPPYPQNYSPYHNYASAPPMAPHPHAGYYPNPNYLPAHSLPVRQSVCSRFARGAVVAIIILIVLFAMFLIIDVFRHRPEKPVYHLAAFSVTNFNISNAILTGNWEAKVIIENPCDSFRISLDRFQSSIYHRNPADSLAWNADGPLSLDAKANTTITLRSSMINSSQPKGPMLDEIDKERKDGSVNFGLMMNMLVHYNLDSEMVWEWPLKILCQGIKVGFAAGSTNGTLVIDKPKECSFSW